MIAIRTITLLILASLLVAAPAPAPDSTQANGGLVVERTPPWGSGSPPWWPGGKGGAKGMKPVAAPQSAGGDGSDGTADTGTQAQAQAGSRQDTGVQSDGGGGGGGRGGAGKGGGGSSGQSPSPAPAPAPGPSSGGSGGGGSGYMSIVGKWRSTIGISALSQDSKLEASAKDTSTSSDGALKHKLNPGSMAQVMAPGNAGNFESVFVGGWLCERPNLPGLSSVCGTMSKGWNHAGQVGHADILSSTKYKKIGCALASGIWTCDLA